MLEVTVFTVLCFPATTDACYHFVRHISPPVMADRPCEQPHRCNAAGCRAPALCIPCTIASGFRFYLERPGFRAPWLPQHPVELVDTGHRLLSLAVELPSYDILVVSAVVWSDLLYRAWLGRPRIDILHSRRGLLLLDDDAAGRSGLLYRCRTPFPGCPDCRCDRARGKLLVIHCCEFSSLLLLYHDKFVVVHIHHFFLNRM